ncbi:acetyl/propionyl/methylcrotonyl-CoA carboxylase subunit alpha [Oceanicoccus sp. KOV_DT_Chl]|uniref:acetyl-CoA carboxylase biotin carboxylase subunit n=1 Tax=Oceanicoccus sp. KOV_DT_Chl TaxID=1904639 RepID=UPI000C7D127E|nr:biotin carboxylase N-terminal domain-containing protein [Oceanicoccus sp. KOV_DT_Chl]
MSMDKLFSKVLIANRGEIALRVLSCLQKMNIASVVVFHDSDRNSPVVRQADEAVEITGESPSAAYLDIAQIVDICQSFGVDAVHPCYGFLAENAEFARALEAAGVCFIGPSPEVIELMGDKIRSREFVVEHGFPVAPSVVMDADEPGFLDAVSHMGLPLVVKASAGGGGKGMSIVRSLDELSSTLKVAASEAEKYFGDKRVYVERYFDSARHIEVQILGDGKRVIHLGERECSVQRRFQKIIEESPSPALDEAYRESLCEVAVGIAQAANYSSAGTVEFLYTPEGEFFFLEMNTRIQVEHAVTEMVTGIDLVAEQIRIASGQGLGVSQDKISLHGHSIECRICAEDTYDNFLPETGKVLYLQEPSGKGVRFDSGLYQNQLVTTAYDPMLAKLVVHASSREKAIEKAIKALQEFVLLGVKVNTDFLVQVLSHDAFVSGEFDTNFITKYAEYLTAREATPDERVALLSAVVLADRAIKTMMEKTPAPYGAIGCWRN